MIHPAPLISTARPPRGALRSSALLGALTVFGFASCSDSDGPTPSISPEPILLIESDRLGGIPGTPFTLQATLAPTPDETAPPIAIVWDLGDGRAIEGESITFEYTAAGLFDVTARALAATPSDPANAEEIASGSITLGVLEAGFIPGTDLPLPVLPGDVDSDGVLTLSDVHTLGLGANQQRNLTTEERLQADFELDGDIDLDDARLLARTVANGGLLPTTISPETGYRTNVVRITAESLKDLNALSLIHI